MKKRDDNACCRIQSLLTVDERGQMVLPKELRERANIKPGDKLALISWERGDSICCFTLMKTDEMSDMVKGMLKPIMGTME